MGFYVTGNLKLYYQYVEYLYVSSLDYNFWRDDTGLVNLNLVHMIGCSRLDIVLIAREKISLMYACASLSTVMIFLKCHLHVCIRCLFA